jgi:hypothetical protein
MQAQATARRAFRKRRPRPRILCIETSLSAQLPQGQRRRPAVTRHWLKLHVTVKDGERAFLTRNGVRQEAGKE